MDRDGRGEVRTGKIGWSSFLSGHSGHNWNFMSENLR